MRAGVVTSAISFQLSPSSCRVTAIHNKCVTDDETCARAAQPKNGSRDFLRPAKSPNRLVSQNVFHGIRFLGQHVRNHWRLDSARTDCIDADSSGGIFERSTLSQPDHSILGCVVNCPARNADQGRQSKSS